MNGIFIIMMLASGLLVSTSATVSMVSALPGDKAIPNIHVYLYFPNGRPAKAIVTVKMGIEVSKTVNTKTIPLEGVAMTDGSVHYGAEVPFKLPMRKRGLLPDLFTVCVYTPSTGENKCNWPYVWWDKPTASDAWIAVYNTH